MPSAASLFAAISLGVVALMVSSFIPALLPEGTDMGNFYIVNFVIGLVVGWISVGTRTGRGWVAGINAGITGVVMLVFWGLFVQACNEMTRLAMRNRYDNAMEAIVAIFELMAEWGLLMLTVPIGVTLLIGGAVTGLIAESAAQRWR